MLMHPTTPKSKLVGLAIASLIVAATTGCGLTNHTAAQQYCAIMPDAIGLYTDNPVTQMGFPIGTVDRITATDLTEVRVDFTLTEPRTLPQDVTAVIRSASILADRRLELVGNYETGPTLQPGDCVPLAHSITPKSISEVFGSATDLLDGISPAGSTNVADAINGLEKLVRDDGSNIGHLLTVSSRLLDSPDQAIADIGTIIQNLAEITTTLSQNTEPLKQIITALPATTPNIVDALDGAGELVDALPGLVHLVDDLEENAGDLTTGILTNTTTVLRLAAGRADDIRTLLDTIPGMTDAARTATTSGHGAELDPPVVAVDTRSTPDLCSILRAVMPNTCIASATQPTGTGISLFQLLTTQVGR